MPIYTEEQLMNMDAIVGVFLNQYNVDKPMELQDIKVYSQLAYSYKVSDPELWEEEAKAANDEEGPKGYERIKNLIDLQERLKRLLEQHQSDSVAEYEAGKKFVGQKFSIRELEYEDIVPEEARHLVLKGDFLKIKAQISAEYGELYDNFHKEASDNRDKATLEIEGKQLDANLYDQIIKDETYKKLLSQKTEIENEIKEANKNSKAKEGEYDVVGEKLEQKREHINNQLEQRAAEIAPEVYKQFLAGKEADLEKIEKDFVSQTKKKFNELNKQTTEAFKTAIKKKIEEETKKIEPSVTNLINTKINSKTNEIKTQQEQIEQEKKAQEELEALKESKKHENPKANNIDVNENEINTSSKVETKPEAGLGNKIQKIYDLSDYETNLQRTILKAIEEKMRQQKNDKVTAQFVDDPESQISMYTNLADQKEAYKREIECVKDTFSKDRELFRVAHSDHIERIMGIHRILKNNKKTGLTKNTNEYTAVLEVLDTFEEKYKENGWKDVVKAENDGKNLTPDQEQKKNDMLDELETVFNFASSYMGKKGPQKKSWGHGQARYDLMYMLCNEIHAAGGHAAEAMSRYKKIDKAFQANKVDALVYLHQIPDAASAQEKLARTYEKKINEAIKENRKALSKQEESARKNNNIIDQNRTMSM